jgi:uncharacterized membrane protein YbhN (UPF0104 family)
VKRVLVHILRFVVCIAALWWALHGLSWHNWITLTDGRRLQVVSTANGRVEVLDPQGQRTSLATADVPRDPDGDPKIEYGVPAVWHQADKSLLAMSLLLFAPVPVLASIRFVRMLRAQDVRIGYWQGIKMTYAGNFFNFVMPGSTGGDIFKAYYVAQHTRHKVEAITAVFLDRVIGLIGIVLLAAAAMTFRLDDPRIRQLSVWILLMLAAMAAGLVTFYLPGLRDRLRPEQRLRWLPGIDKLLRIDRAALRMREHRGIVLAAFGYTVVLQTIAVGAFYLWGLAMGMRPDWPSYYAYIGVSLVVMSIPVTPMGLGTMEAALMLFLRGPFGTKGQVLFLALGIRLIQFAWALLGVLVPLTGAHRPSADRMKELEAEIAVQEQATPAAS